MVEKVLKKQVVNKIGRVFSMLFNRAIMYDMKHPFTAQSIKEFYRLINDELTRYSPIVLIMHQDKFFVEEEPLDPKLNTGKLLSHFKKTAIQSLLFEKGMTREDLEIFFHVIIDTAKNPNIEKMMQAVVDTGVSKIKLNYVFYQKVTAEDAIIEKDSIKDISETKRVEKQKKLKTELLDMLTGGIALDNLTDSLSVSQLVGGSEKLAEYVVQTGTSQAAFEDTAECSPVLLQNIGKIKTEVNKAVLDVSGAKLHELAASVVKMRAELLDGLNEKKKSGVAYQDEEKIIAETNELADEVILKLIKDEYKQGATSINRLSQILRRLIPDNDELQRFLPKLKETLLLEGMSLDDFLELTGELEKELESSNVSEAIKKSAEDIGVSGEELLNEITSNPAEAAELIYLASEIRKETGDKKVLTDVLVDYVEKIGTKIALNSSEVQADTGSSHLKSIISNVESEIVAKLKNKEIEHNVLDKVIERLDQRMEGLIAKLEDSLEKRDSEFGTWDHETTSLLKMFEDNVGDTEELKVILKEVHDKYLDQDSGRINIFEMKKAMAGESSFVEPSDTKITNLALPKGVHNRKSMLYFIDREIVRSSRYKTPFSTVTLSILKAIPQKKFAAGTINHDTILYAVLHELSSHIRDTDVFGQLDRQRMICLMPMTSANEGRLAMNRLLKKIHTNMIRISEVPIEIKLAASVTFFNKKETDNLKEFIQKAETDITKIVQRLKNLQSLY